MVHLHSEAKRPRIPANYWPVIEQALLLSQTIPINRSYDIPYVAGYPVRLTEVFIDRHLPTEAFGYQIDRFLTVHECVEKMLLDAFDCGYEIAHPIAEWVEEEHAKKLGWNLDWYREFYRKYVKEIGSEKLVHVPRTLDLTPYKDEHDIKEIHKIYAAMDSKLLTKKKKAWVKQFKPTTMIRGHALHNNHADAVAYHKQLSVLVDYMIEETEKELVAHFKGEAAEKHFAADDSVASQARIITNRLERKFDQLFNRRSKGLAVNMISRTKKTSRSVLNSSLKELSGGLSLKTDILTGKLADVLIATTAENVALIKSIPAQYLGKVQGAVMRSIATGNGLQDLIPKLKKYGASTHKRARMIAYDQTRKTYNGINKARMDAIGIKQAEWLHSGGSNAPRETHVAMNGKVFKLDEGMYDSEVEEFIQPGQLPNCRCTYRPVIEFEDGKSK